MLVIQVSGQQRVSITAKRVGFRKINVLLNRNESEQEDKRDEVHK
jgi:hypothetical protein